jgi:hypothetical protein
VQGGVAGEGISNAKQRKLVVPSPRNEPKGCCEEEEEELLEESQKSLACKLKLKK